jgi:hypothetical protein
VLVVAKVDDDLLCSRLLHTVRPNNPTSTSARQLQLATTAAGNH